MMQTPVEGELFVTVVEGALPPAPSCQPKGGERVVLSLLPRLPSGAYSPRFLRCENPAV